MARSRQRVDARRRGSYGGPKMSGIMDRKTYIGGSDAAAILGVSPWATPLKTYYQKIGDTLPEDMIDDPARERLFKRGKLMEPVIIEMLIDSHPIKITK